MSSQYEEMLDATLEEAATRFGDSADYIGREVCTRLELQGEAPDRLHAEYLHEGRYLHLFLLDCWKRARAEFGAA